MKIIHNCTKNPKKIPQEYELEEPIGGQASACHCGWCGRDFQLSTAHHQSEETYSNPFDARGYFTSKAEAGKFDPRGTFYPIPEENQFWKVLEEK